MIGLGKEVVQDELVIENTGSGYQNVQSDRRDSRDLDNRCARLDEGKNASSMQVVPGQLMIEEKPPR